MIPYDMMRKCLGRYGSVSVPYRSGSISNGNIAILSKRLMCAIVILKHAGRKGEFDA